MRAGILYLAEGARAAKGVTVVIDVFRAYTLEAYLLAWGAGKIIPVADAAEAYRLKEEIPGSLLAGERHGRILPGFDLGNSPSSVDPAIVKGKTVIHTTSAGTQGLILASGADELLTGSLVNAAATAKYIRSCGADDVSLVAMGWEGRKRTEEDELCAEYLRALILGEPFDDIEKKADDLRYTEGRKFFDPLQQDVFPEGDFAMCAACDIFDFAIRVKKENGLFVSEKIMP